MAALTTASLFSLTLCPTPTQAQDESAPTQIVGIARLTPEAEASIKKGLAYLAKAGVQNPDGSWGGGVHLHSGLIIAQLLLLN